MQNISQFIVLSIGCRNYCKSNGNISPKSLYKYLLRQCQKLPKGAKDHYTFMVKQVI